MRFSSNATQANRGKVKHTISLLTDDDLAQIYHALPDGHAIKDAIKQHLIDCVSTDDLEDSDANTGEEYINNWLNPDPILYNA